MAIKMYANGTSFDAIRSNSGKTGFKYGATVPDIVAGGLAGSYINLGTTITNSKAVTWPGKDNLPAGKNMSVIFRFSPTYSGAPTARRALFEIGAGAIGPRIQLYHEITSGQLVLEVRNETPAAVVSFVNLGVWNTNVANTEYDFVLTLTGDTTANGYKLYINNALHGQATATGSIGVNWNTIIRYIMVGMSTNGTLTAIRLHEIAIDDTIIDPSSYPLVGGNGALNGSARTALLNVTPFDAQSSVDPGITHVEIGTGYTINGVSLTGTYTGANRWETVPSAKVENAYSYLANGVTLTGSAVASQDPGVGNVRLDTDYVINGVTLTGTLVVPTPGTGASGTCDLVGIMNNLQYIFEQANTTTASPIDLSYGLDVRVQKVLAINPDLLPIQASFYPAVTCRISSKDVTGADINRNQLLARRQVEVMIEVFGLIFNNTIPDKTRDQASEQIYRLMENIELILRADPTLGGKVLFQVPVGCEFFSPSLDSKTIARAGILSVKARIQY